MADVAAKIISANNVKAGTITVNTSGKKFDYDDEHVKLNPDDATPTAYEAQYQDRFDDPTYYTA